MARSACMMIMFTLQAVPYPLSFCLPFLSLFFSLYLFPSPFCPTHPLQVVTNVPHVRVESRHLAKKTLPAHLLHICSPPFPPCPRPDNAIGKRDHVMRREIFAISSCARRIGKTIFQLNSLKISVKSFSYFCLFSFNQRASYFKWKTNIPHMHRCCCLPAPNFIT